MSEQDIVPSGQTTGSEVGTENEPVFLRQADDPYAQGDMPPALLEFHSPTAALVNMPPTPSAQYITWIVGALIVSSVTVMTVFPLDRVVSTQGRLVSTEQTLLVQPLDTSIIRSIDVREGDFVHKGTVLAHLDPTMSGADIENMRAQSDQYQAEVDRLTAETQGQTYSVDPKNPSSVQQAEAFVRRKAEFDAKVRNYDKQIASLQNQLQSAQASAAMYAARAKVAADVHKMRMQLQKDQVGSKLSTLGAQNELMEVERSQIAAQQEAGSTRNKLAAQVSEREGYIQNWKAEAYHDLVLAEHHLSEAKSSYQKAVLHNSLVTLKADEDAIVLNISKVSVGAVLTAGEKVMTLVPVGKGLEIETVMSGKDVGFVRLGDKALVKFATFPYQQYGGADATVRTISADSFVGSSSGSSQQDNEVTPDSSSKEFYRVRLRVDRYTLHGVPSFFHPLPGMPVTADVRVGKRTIMQYLLNSFMPLMTDGMREP
ncbi:HlyD family type I secretion periplasmic adaptor subunit [Acetobacter orleanensis]|uniref:Membrane fusion protein (MFP) family protein n=1 Tax=Acetobacter orleanensis TaxID=104099 RepID=A0A4Y3TM61_9PROT|nr:HlyD family type I secretion periplasmic adaptor subunit [Acetobacter orleanensis]KXV62743.1 multidrug ABC transporter [Acetobacter orleanensis]PCD79263.1 HlyD family type I secretion periplasmic adaptor subunit [Acetobacter orleanensis]GAN67876.1 multidrug resistance efflux pump HlyD/EmrA/FusE [Acetobacter orleanensis JCM 7639]GBR24170.1 major facilitator superfamily multidrug resistance transporter EmrA/FusE [Acetobacter orleanensis NRIC 0473]GEB83446.1 HlyD family type I secretion peripl